MLVGRTPVTRDVEDTLDLPVERQVQLHQLLRRLPKTPYPQIILSPSAHLRSLAQVVQMDLRELGLEQLDFQGGPFGLQGLGLVFRFALVFAVPRHRLPRRLLCNWSQIRVIMEM